MSVKETVVNESIERATKRIVEIDFILSANPISEIIEIRKEAQRLLNKTKDRSSKEFLNKIEELANREKEQFRIGKKQKDTVKLIEEKVELEIELTSLNSELYYINLKN